MSNLLVALVSLALIGDINAQPAAHAGKAEEQEKQAFVAWIRSLFALSDPFALPANTKWTVTAALKPLPPETLGQ